MSHYESKVNVDFSAREPQAATDAQFPTRWSPRSFRKMTLADTDIEVLIDAARWAPSCFNEQPWRFLTSTEPSFERFLECLIPANQRWAANAALLGFIYVEKQFAHNDKPNAWAEFDAGAAWMSLTLQARRMGLYTHGMAGIDAERIYREFDLNREQQHVIAGFAVGVLAPSDALPEGLQDKESPSPRKPLDDIWRAVS